MYIGLFFGSFNPIHTGHLIIANHIRQETPLDQVWFVVSPQNPLKKSNSLLNEYHRLELVRLAIDDEPGLKAVDIEFHLPRPSFTVDTLTYLQEKYPEHKFSIIMGSDSYLNLPNWKNYETLLRNHPIYVYERSGFQEKKTYPGSSVFFVKAPLLDISATHIRNLIASGKSARFLLPDKVQEEIKRNSYYKSI